MMDDQETLANRYFSDVDKISKETWRRIYNKGIHAVNLRLKHKNKPLFFEYSNDEDFQKFIDWLNTLEEPK